MNPRVQRWAFVTGSRAEFGLLTPVLRALRGRQGIECRIIATGMHLLRRFGRTLADIEAAGYPVAARVPMQSGRDDAAREPRAVAAGVRGIAAALDRLECRGVVVLGDRIEAFAGACAGALGRRVVAHIHGGDRAPGSVDDMLRNAITRLAHIHLAASREAAGRLIRMGEPRPRVFMVGAPGLDDIRDLLDREAPGARRRRAAECLGWETQRRYALLVQHPTGRAPSQEARSLRAAVEAIERAGLSGVVIWPNSDPGHSGIIGEIERLNGRPGWRVLRSLPREAYLRVASSAACLVGNSSSGIIESASLGVRAVNIGERQAGRLRCGPGVIDVADNPAAIAAGVRRALRPGRPRRGRSVYGDGHAGRRIARILAQVRENRALLHKTLAW